MAKAKPVKVDFHLHVGEVFAGRKGSTPAEPERCADYLKSSGITHAVVCYSDKAAMSSLVKLCPGIKFFKLQWVTDLQQKLDKGIQGVKLHSHRGRSSGFAFGEDAQLGLDYSSRDVRDFLRELPEDFIVEYHTQGSSSITSASRPFMIGKLATEFRHLKHVIVHSGAFGMRSFYPTNGDSSLMITALSQEMLVQEAALMANRLANVYCEASTLIGPCHYKTDILMTGTEKAALGSDWPYSEVCPYGTMEKAEQLVSRYIGEQGVQDLHNRALAWLTTPVATLNANYGDGVVDRAAGHSARYKELRAEIDSHRRKDN